MFRIILRRYGIGRVNIGITLIAIVLSVGITWVVNALLQRGPLGEGLVIAIVVPMLVAPIMKIQILRLLQLDEAEQRLQVLSYTDDLTQTYNRRYFMQYIDQEFKRAKRYGTTFSVVLLDIDNFKQINDQWGHLVGDQVLHSLTQMLKASLRDADICERYGGDEFILLFPQTDKLQTEIWVRRVYETFAASFIQVDEMPMAPLFSVGVAAFEASFDSFEQVLKQADDALYEAKHTGGNHFVLN
jgi:diguanylate cyclase (GGDEF)-like protein